MESHEHWTTIMANIATTAGFLGLVAVYFGYKQTQAHFSFSVMLSCIERFQRLLPLEVNGQYDLTNIRLYVDLTNEEFFYFQRKYIPKEVIVEWLDSISMNFPLYANNEPLPINYDRALPKFIHDNDLLVGYPRLKWAFKITISGNALQDRTARIQAIGNQLGISLKRRHFKMALVES